MDGEQRAARCSASDGARGAASCSSFRGGDRPQAASCSSFRGGDRPRAASCSSFRGGDRPRAASCCCSGGDPDDRLKDRRLSRLPGKGSLSYGSARLQHVPAAQARKPSVAKRAHSDAAWGRWKPSPPARAISSISPAPALPPPCGVPRVRALRSSAQSRRTSSVRTMRCARHRSKTCGAPSVLRGDRATARRGTEGQRPARVLHFQTRGRLARTPAHGREARRPSYIHGQPVRSCTAA